MEYKIIGIRIYDYDFTNSETGERISGRNVELHTTHDNYKYPGFHGDVVETIKIKRSDLTMTDEEIFRFVGQKVIFDVIPGSGKVVGIRLVK